MSPPRKSSRREFLRGKSAVDTLSAVAQSATIPLAEAVPTRTASPPQTYLIRVGRRAMACEFEVLLNAGQYADGTEMAVMALDLVDRLESQLTVFREESEVSRLNRSAFEGEVEVEPRLFELLRLAVEIHGRTAGAYDVTSGPLSRMWGFHRRAGRMPTDAELVETLRRTGSRHLALDPRRGTVRFLVPEMEINLGSIGKGHALDRCAELLESHGLADFLLHGGQSSVLARGSRGLSANEGWWVGLRHPLRPGQRLAEIRLRNRGLATSGTGTQFFIHEGRRYGHLLDPRTGRPAESLLSTTVLAPTAAEADALSTAFYVMGYEPALEYCHAHAGLAAVLVKPGPRAGSVEVGTCGLEDADWKLLET
jgi:FAD:protein FMN transferase